MARSRWGTWAFLVGTVAVVLVVAYFVVRPSGTAAYSSVELKNGQVGAAVATGQEAPDFTATSTDGETVSLSALRGRPVWVTFGATWCQSCRVEAPDMEKAYAKTGQTGVAMLSVYLSEDAETVRTYAQRAGLTYPHIPDPDTEVASRYGVVGVPTHYFVDASGVVRRVKVGIMTSAEMDAAMAELRG